MPPLVVIGLVAGGLATLAVLDLVRPALGGRMVWPAAGAALASAIVTSLVGVLSGAGSLSYFLGISSFALPVLVLLEAAAIGSGADRVARWVLMLAWGVLVFPVAATLPLLLTADCVTSECRFEDFGGALPLFVSSTVFVFLAWLPAGVRGRPILDRGTLTVRGAVAAVLCFWIAFIVWLASLEGAIDAYTPRILLAGVLGPLSAAAGWLIVDRLRNVNRKPARSLGLGLLAGMLAVSPGAVSVSFPWLLMVGGLAGIIAGVVYAALGRQASVAARWGVTLLVATAVGFLAPPISGDTVGILFSAQVSGLIIPALAFIGVAVYSLLVSAPAWILVRRHANRTRREQAG